MFIKYWLPVIVFSGLIILASSIPGRANPFDFHFKDKFIHGLEYAVLAWLWFRAIRVTTPNQSPLKIGMLTVLVCSVFGFLDESYQLLIPDRVSDKFDLLADATGSFLSVSLAIIKSRFDKK